MTNYISIVLKYPISFETAKNIDVPVKHYITKGGSDRIHILVVAEENRADVLAFLRSRKIEVRG